MLAEVPALPDNTHSFPHSSYSVPDITHSLLTPSLTLTPYLTLSLSLSLTPPSSFPHSPTPYLTLLSPSLTLSLRT